MTLHINEDEVRSLLTMPMAVEAVEDISRKQANGEVVVHPRRRFEFKGNNFFHYMAAADHTDGFIAMKQYTYVRGKMRFLVPLILRRREAPSRRSRRRLAAAPHGEGTHDGSPSPARRAR